MSRSRYRGNVLSAAFPLLSSFGGQSIIVPQIDQYYIRQNTFSGNEADRLIGIPQVLFLENIMPMTNGLQSIGYDNLITQTANHDFDQALYLRDSLEFQTLFVPANGKNYLYDFVHHFWTTQPTPATFGALVSTPNIKNRQFLFYAKSKAVYEWDGAALTPAAVSALDLSQIMGFVAANAYLVAYSETSLFWSSIVEPTDFVPSLSTGAGSSDILSLKGSIVCCTPIADGFLIYTTANIICASYSGNANFPWVFKELNGSSGITAFNQASHDTTNMPQFAFTVGGMMALDRANATNIWPEVDEFISGRRYEMYDYDQKKIVEVDTNNALLTAVNFLASRYVILSYGDNVFSFAIVYDTALKRFGKLRIDHVDCFEFIDQRTATILGPGLRYRDLVGTYADQTRTYLQYGHYSFPVPPPIRYFQLHGTYADQYLTKYKDYDGFAFSHEGFFISTGEEPYKSIGFLQENGAIYVANFDMPITTQNSVLYIGKYQLTRGRLTNLYETWLENTSPSAKQTVLAIIPSLDGFNLLKPVYPYLDKTTSSGRLQKWLSNVTAMNFTLRIEGNILLSSHEMVFDQAGYR